MEFIQGGVCAPKGFMAAATAAKIKYEGRDDMALILSETPCEYAGVFTKNVVKAAPVLWDKSVLDTGSKVSAVVVNSGIANAATGEEGKKKCEETADYAGKVFGVDRDSVLVCSTGVIGYQLPMDRIRSGIDALSKNPKHSDEAALSAAKAIMTTDTHEKQVAVTMEISGKEVRIGAMAKGSGMIHPNMGTMLSFITTDCNIEKSTLNLALHEVCVDTFNMVSVDGDTSTNDTCILLANGKAGNDTVTLGSDEYEIFKNALFSVCREISMMLAGDGEGATALMEVVVDSCDSKEKARILAKSVITSSLTKAAIFGHDANWGRILCALGYAGVDFIPEKIDISVSGDGKSMVLVKNGQATDYSEEEASCILSSKKVTITCNINEGKESATAWGCDLSYDYVKINADYRS